MIDLGLLKTKEGIEKVKKSERKRGREKEVDEIVQMVQDRIKARYEMDQLNKEMNSLTREGMKHFKGKKETNIKEKERIVAAIAEIKRKKAEHSIKLSKIEKDTDAAARKIGNIIHPSVKEDKDENNNPVIYTKKYTKKSFNPDELLPFDQVLEKLNAIDMDRGAKISGHRGYFLKNTGVILAQALIRYAMEFLQKKEYTLIQTPYIMNKEMMMKTAQLSDFDEQLYKVEGGPNEAYLIATSEQPISALHSDEWIGECDLPMRYCGYSTCFRKEAGAHGKDNKGIFRVHQFEKIEQFIVTSPDKSEQEFTAMVDRAKEFYDTLGISYQIVSIVSGALNNAAAIKYDLEAYFPAADRFRELVSCSNCTDYQSRDLNVRYGFVDTAETAKLFVHMLNGTLCAIQRTLCCLVENYQTQDGLMIPDALVPYAGTSFFPYTKK